MDHAKIAQPKKPFSQRTKHLLHRSRLAPGVAEITRNTNGPARITGNHFRWIANIQGAKTFCNTREEARSIVRNYKKSLHKITSNRI
jgi:hypothetical protein